MFSVWPLFVVSCILLIWVKHLPEYGLLMYATSAFKHYFIHYLLLRPSI